MLEEIINLREENIELHEQLTAQDKREEIAAKVKRDGNAYYFAGEDGEKTGPYCLACWDYEGKLINMTQGQYGSIQRNICAARLRAGKLI